LSLGAVLWEGTDEVVAYVGIEGEIGWSSGYTGDSSVCVAGIKSDLANCRKIMYSSGEVEDCKNRKIITKYIKFPIDFGIAKASKTIFRRLQSKVKTNKILDCSACFPCIYYT
jgi:hypothetical protein